jgi:hypothetical protein
MHRPGRIRLVGLGLAMASLLAPVAASAAAAVKGPPAAPHTFSVPGRLRALSCPTASVCLGITLADKATRWGVIRITHEGAKSHTTLVKKKFTLVAISCPSALGCRVLAQNTRRQTDVILPVGVDGAIGTPRGLGAHPTDALTTIACYAAPTSCTLVGEEGNVISVVTMNGANATRHTLTLANSVLGIAIGGLVCPTSTQCFAVGSLDLNGKVQGLIEPVLNGKPGSPIEVAGGSDLGVVGIACVSATRCYAVGDGGRAVIYTLTGGAVTHKVSMPKSIMLFGIACQSAHLCDAVGTKGQRKGVVVPIDRGKHGKPQTTSVTVAYGSEGGAADPIAGFPGGIEIAGIDDQQVNKTVVSSS